MKIRIFQPIVPEYRVALFEGVARRYGSDVEIWAAEGTGQDRSYPLRHMQYDYSHSFRRFGPLVWQGGLSLKGLQKGDVIVVCGDVHQLSSLWIALKARCSGIKVVWWGHHKTATSKPFGVWIRLAIAKRLSDVFLCYTQTGVKYLEEHGFRHGRVFATGNTIDQGPIKAAEAYYSTHSQLASDDEQPPTSNYLLCCGVMREKVHLDLFIRAMADSRLKDLGLVVIGDGPMKAAWQRLAEELGVADRIKWIPGTRDQMVMAPWFMRARAFIYPGSIGLSILHSFSYGLPVITHGNTEHQMPEFEVMEDGKTGLCYQENDLESLIAVVTKYVSDEVGQKNMARYCRDIAYGKYSMRQMIENYSESIDVSGRIS